MFYSLFRYFCNLKFYFGYGKTSFLRAVLIVLALCSQHLYGERSQAATPKDYIVQLSTSVSTSPAQVTISWPAYNGATGYNISRKAPEDAVYSLLASLPASQTSYNDATVSRGKAYEYQVVRYTSSITSLGYIAVGLEAPLTEKRGKIVLIVDNTMTQSLSAELARLQSDLVGDGWQVVRHDVSRTAKPSAVRDLIRANYMADPTNVRSVFLLGHIPVPYSGNIYPDGHEDHQGAWPADLYYGEMDGTWTDSSVDNTAASRAANDNVPGDGKFDQSQIPSVVELQVGRVDLSNMPAFGVSETELLRRYLNKDHNYRQRIFAPQPRAIIDDNFGNRGSEHFSSSGWGSFSSLLGSENVVASDWFSTLENGSAIWAYGSGSGSYTSASGVGTTANFASKSSNVVFTMLFGSYFGDWNSTNNFLRAPLAANGYGLTSAWSGRPLWHVHHMGIGETIGYSTRVTQNNYYLYASGRQTRSPHIALMGDPSLRLHVVTPPRNLTAYTSTQGVSLNWTASSDAVQGYHVYRASNANAQGYNNSFVRLTNLPTTSANYIDNAAPNGEHLYMVRAIKLESTNSGSYFNASQGAFVEHTVAPTVIPEAPLNLVATAGNAQVSLSWNAALWAAGYNIYRGNTSGGRSATPINSVPLTDLVYSDLNAQNGVTYYYTVKAVNSVGESASSNEVSARPQHPGPGGVNDAMLWLKSDEGLTKDDKDLVSTWQDQSGNAKNGTAAGTNRPLFVQNALNEQPVLRFDGSTDFFRLPSGFNDFTQGVTAFVVGTPTKVPSVTARWFELGNSTSVDGFGLTRSSSDTYVSRKNRTVSSLNDPSPLPLGTSYLLSVVHEGGSEGASTTSALYRNGILRQTGTAFVPSKLSRSINHVGKSSSTGYYFEGDIAEVIIYSRALPSAEREKVEQYLLRKYSLGGRN